MRPIYFLVFSLAAILFNFWTPEAQARCVKEYENLCILPSANLSRINRAPKVLEAAKAYAKKMKPYGLVMVTSGYRDAKGQRAKQASGVQAGAASGSNMSAHIYGVALDLSIKGNSKLTKPTCEALISVMPLLGKGGGVIHEGCGGGSCDVHVDDNWGSRHWGGQTVMYASKGNCNSVGGMKKIGKGSRTAMVSTAPTALDVPADPAAAPQQVASADTGGDDRAPASVEAADAGDAPRAAPEPEPVAEPEPKKAAPTAKAAPAAFDGESFVHPKVQAYKKKISSPQYQREIAERRARRARENAITPGELMQRAIGGER